MKEGSEEQKYGWERGIVLKIIDYGELVNSEISLKSAKHGTDMFLSWHTKRKYVEKSGRERKKYTTLKSNYILW